jgi:hypothetical protein
VGEGSDDILRYPGDSPDAAMSVQYRGHHGAVIQIPLLASVLLCVHQEAEESALEAGAKRPELGPTVRVSRHLYLVEL